MKTMKDKILNITNGDYFNEYFLSHFGGEALPFCEAMMEGDTVLEIYSEEFIRLRSREVGVSAEEYRAKMQVYDALNGNDYTELRLWFGKDTFCQANLLTLLAYLEQIKFDGKVILTYIDDETFEVLGSDIVVELGLYRKLYEDIFIKKMKPEEPGVLVPESIDLYFDYHSDEGFLVTLVKKNAHKDKTALVCLLIENSKEYGLSDQQAEKLIKRYLKNM